VAGRVSRRPGICHPQYLLTASGIHLPDRGSVVISDHNFEARVF
jgi:hypothetical protein